MKFGHSANRKRGNPKGIESLSPACTTENQPARQATCSASQVCQSSCGALISLPVRVPDAPGARNTTNLAASSMGLPPCAFRLCAAASSAPAAARAVAPARPMPPAGSRHQCALACQLPAHPRFVSFRHLSHLRSSA